MNRSIRSTDLLPDPGAPLSSLGASGSSPLRPKRVVWTALEKCAFALWGVGAAAMIFFALVPGLHASQNLMSIFLLFLLMVVYRLSKSFTTPRVSKVFRLTVILITMFLSMRYIYWRATDTLPLQYGLASLFLGLMLFMAEFYGFVNSSMGCFINSDPKIRQPVPLDKLDGDLPHVDVYIPTYNEAAVVVRPTVIAATQLNYPKEKLHVCLLDDGGTLQKLNDPDPLKAEVAQKRAAELRAIAARFGARYITREANTHAKAGNLNNALTRTLGELVLVLDCDHIPTEDFLRNTVGFFVADPHLFVVQTPHNFVSPDPVARNLFTFKSSPAENELFYDVIQPGLDYWGTSFFCGSAAVLRRSVLDRLGGIAGQTITEDAETTIDALALGYSTAYFDRPMVSALQPETYSSFILQRVRWGQGMLQIFMLKNVWRQPGLKLIHRILYTNFAFYWGFAAARLIMLLAPPTFLLFAVNLCDTTAEDLLAYAVPTLLASLISTQYFYGKVRWPFMSQLYEIIQSIYITQGMLAVLRRPRSPSFQVTPKGEVLDHDVLSALAKPFYALLALNLAGIVSGVVRYLSSPWSHGAIVLVEFWAMIDFVLLLCALGITFERRQMRTEPRVAHAEPIRVHGPGGAWVDGLSVDVSASGSGISIRALDIANLGWQPESALSIEFSQRGVKLPARLVTSRRIAPDRWALGLRYQFATELEERVAISIAFGSSDALERNNEARHGGRTLIFGLLYLVKVAMTLGMEHLGFLARLGAQDVFARGRRLMLGRS